MKKFSMALFAALAFVFIATSCSKDEITDQLENGKAMKFRVNTGKMTKSTEIEMAGLQNAAIAIHVFDDSGNPYNIVSSGNNTIYLKYASGWQTYADSTDSTPTEFYFPETGQTLKFIATMCNNTGVMKNLALITSGGQTIIEGDAGLPADCDIICATTEGNSNSSSMVLQFNHVVSQIRFIAKCDFTGYNLQVNSLSFYAYNHRSELTYTFEDYDQTSSSGFWSGFATISDFDPVPLSSPISNIEALDVQLGGNYFLPAQSNQTLALANARIVLSYTIYDNSSNVYKDVVNETVYFGDLESGTHQWQGGIRYTYTLNITGDNATSISDIITVNLDPWTNHTPIPIKPTIVN